MRVLSIVIGLLLVQPALGAVETDIRFDFTLNPCDELLRPVTKITSLTTAPSRYSTPSSDGKTMLWKSNSPELHYLGPNKKSVRLPDQLSDHHVITVSPDDRLITFVNRENDQSSIAIFDVEVSSIIWSLKTGQWDEPKVQLGRNGRFAIRQGSSFRVLRSINGQAKIVSTFSEKGDPSHPMVAAAFGIQEETLDFKFDEHENRLVLFSQGFSEFPRVVTYDLAQEKARRTLDAPVELPIRKTNKTPLTDGRPTVSSGWVEEDKGILNLVGSQGAVDLHHGSINRISLDSGERLESLVFPSGYQVVHAAFSSSDNRAAVFLREAKSSNPKAVLMVLRRSKSGWVRSSLLNPRVFFDTAKNDVPGWYLILHMKWRDENTFWLTNNAGELVEVTP